MSGYNFIRRSLCFFNLIFWITGCCLIGLGTWLAISDYQYFRILPSYHFLSAENLLLFCGLLTAIIAFFGCVGSWFEKKFLLHSYLIFILIIMVLEVLVGSLGYFYRLNVQSQLKYELLSGIKEHYNETDSNGIRQGWDHLQTRLKCCGVLSYTDWHNITAWPGLSKIPGSCCMPPKTNSVIYDPRRSEKDQFHCDVIYKNGCFKEIWLYFQSSIYCWNYIYCICIHTILCLFNINYNHIHNEK